MFYFTIYALNVIELSILKSFLFFKVSTKVNIVHSTPHPMLSEQRLCWLNSSVQLVLSNNYLIENMSNHPFLMSIAQNINVNQSSIACDLQEYDISLTDFYSKIEESTIRYLFDILKSSLSKPLGKQIIEKYIEDLRHHGPKEYVLEINDHVPLIQPMGRISCINDYLSNILLKSISNFIDIHTIWHYSLECSQCRADNVAVIEQHSLLKLFTSDCENLSLPDVALKNYFRTNNNNNSNTCSACGKASDQNQYLKEIVQLPDALFLSFIQNKCAENDDDQVKPTEFFIQNHLDMSMFASRQLICYPSYFRYQLKSFIISMGDSDDNRHHYTFAKYGEQFYRCNDELIEPVDKSVVFDRKYSVSTAMFVREKTNNVNFTEIIHQILSYTENLPLPTSVGNSHVQMMFDAALEYVARHTKALCWSYGAVYTCLQCKQSEF